MQITKEKRQQTTDGSIVTPRIRRFLNLRPPRILPLLTLALLTLPGYAQITPSDDAYVNSASATTNYGGATTINLVSGSQTSFIRFDLTAVPSSYTGSQVAKATLKLFVNSVTTGGTFNVDTLGGSWSEKTITYNLQPAITTTIASSVSLATANKNSYLEIDITSTVQAWLNGTTPNDGIALVANSPLSASFTTKENTGTSHPPELDIVFYGSGVQGPQGPAGPQGVQGPQGLQGNAGPIGPAGPQGPTGAVGVVNRGTWSPSTQYQDNDAVSYNGSSWIALLPNLDSAPNATNPAWQLLAAKGINNQGSWVQTINYQVDDAVTQGGQFWIAIAPNIASQPNLLSPNWQLIAAQGSQGSAGPAGPQGPQGTIGPAGPAGPQGSQGPAGVQGVAGPAGATGPMGLQGPAGPQGSQGPMGPVGPLGPAGPQGNSGPAGPVGMNNRGAWSPGVSYQPNDAVTDQGQFWLATGVTDGQEPAAGSPVWLLIATKGADGALGPAGPPGPMGFPGPQGPPGATGPAGAQGAAGPQGPTGNPGTGILNGTQDFTGSGAWNSPAGVTRVIVELWGAGGGGGSCGGNIFCGNPGGGGGAGGYSRTVMTVTPLTSYFVTIGSGGAQDSDGGSTQFNAGGQGGTVLLQSGGGRQGGDGGGFNNCYHASPACGSGGAPDSTAQIGHTGASGSFLTNCAPSGAVGYPTPGFSTTVGAGGSGVYTSSLKCSPSPQVTGQNGYAVLTW